jgi:hypothetical protein
VRLGGERFFHPQGLAALAEPSGALQVAAFFGGYDLGDLSERSKRLIAVLRHTGRRTARSAGPP